MVTRDILKTLLLEICDEAERDLLAGGPMDSDYVAVLAVTAFRRAIVKKLGD